MNRCLTELAARYPGRRVLITGAASGLGFELGKRFAAAGWRVGALDQDEQRLQEQAAALREAGDGEVHALVADVADWSQVKDTIDSFTGAVGGLDILVNNAGVALGGTFDEVPLEDWRWILDINLMGVVHGCRAALPALRNEPAGLIVNVASAAAFMSSPEMSGYNASKAAVVSLSETLYGELLDTPVDVCAAMPAFFKTNLLERLHATETARESARLLMEHSRLTPREAAQTILEGMARRRLYILVPPKLKTLWRFKRLFPETFARKLKRLRERRIAALREAD